MSGKDHQNTINRHTKEGSIAVQQRRERNKEIYQRVRAACAKFKGMAEIGGGYVVVDIRHFDIMEKGRHDRRVTELLRHNNDMVMKMRALRKEIEEKENNE